MRIDQISRKSILQNQMDFEMVDQNDFFLFSGDSENVRGFEISDSNFFDPEIILESQGANLDLSFRREDITLLPDSGIVSEIQQNMESEFDAALLGNFAGKPN